MGYLGEREKAKRNSSSSDLEGQIERGPGEHFSKRGHNEVMSNQLTKEERRLERKLVRKIDQRVIPLTVSLYLLVGPMMGIHADSSAISTEAVSGRELAI